MRVRKSILHYMFFWLVLLSLPALATTQENKVPPNNNPELPVLKLELTKSIEIKNSTHTYFDATLIQTLAIIVGLAGIFWQLHVQKKNAIFLKEKETINELKLKIYESLLERCSEASLKVAGISTIGVSISTVIYSFRETVGNNPQARWSGLTAESFNKDFYNSLGTVTDLVITLEGYEIVSPNLSIFKLAFSDASREAMEAFNNLYSTVLGFIGWNDTEEGNRPRFLANDPKLEEITALGNIFHEKVTILSGYVHDLKVEAQNTLLGELFNSRAIPRKPLDKKYMVIKTDEISFKELENYFNSKIKK